MWLSIFSVVTLIVLSALLLIFNQSWTRIKALPSEIKRDLKAPAIDEQNIIIQVVGFSKLWFRKQFSLIDKELGSMDKSLLRTGLIAVREEYSEKDAAQTLHWQIEQARQERLRVISALEALSSNLLPLGLLIACGTLLLQLSNTLETTTQLVGIPALTILIFVLFTNICILKTLSHRLYANLDRENHAFRLCAEGLMMIHQHKTPAQVRALLEGMTNGLDVERNVRAVESRPNTQQIRERNRSFFSNQRAS